MQSAIYVDKDYDKASHRAIKPSAEMHNYCIIYLLFDATEGGDPGTVIKAACLESRWSRARTPL